MKRMFAFAMALTLLAGVSVHGETGQVQWMEAGRHCENRCYDEETSRSCYDTGRGCYDEDHDHTDGEHGWCHEECRQEQEVRDYLESHAWEQFVQAPLLYTFGADGTTKEYFVGTDGKAEKNDESFYAAYELHGQTLWLCDSDGRWTPLELVDAADRYRWDRSVVDLVPESGAFFYETTWEPAEDDEFWMGDGPQILVPSADYSVKRSGQHSAAPCRADCSFTQRDLQHGFWEMSFQSVMVYQFRDDGEVVEYDGLTPGELRETTYPGYTQYAFYGDVLFLGGEDGWTRLELVNRDDDVQWAKAAEHHLPEAQSFFYETGWQEPDRSTEGWQDECPMYLVPSHSYWSVVD